MKKRIKPLLFSTMFIAAFTLALADAASLTVFFATKAVSVCLGGIMLVLGRKEGWLP